MSGLSENDKVILDKGVSDRWLHKSSGQVVYLEKGYDFSLNEDWFKIPEEAQYATYSNNSIRHDVLLFWRNQEYTKFGILTGVGNCFNPKELDGSWFNAGSLEDFLTEGTYKGRIVWSSL